jgi:hypothetical protein
MFLRLENTRRTTMLQTIEACDFHQRSIGRKIAFEDSNATSGRERCIAAPYHLTVRLSDRVELFGQRAPGNGEALAMRVAAIEKCLEDYLGPTSVIDVSREEASAGLEIRNEGRTGENLGDGV